jgi:hypothetical protein
VIPKRYQLALLPLMLSALAIYAITAHSHYPIQEWLVWRYLLYWLCTATWLLACLAAGHATVRRVVGHTLPIVEQATIGLAVGVLEFGLAMFVAGIFGLYGTTLFVALPLAMLALGGRSLWRFARRCRRHFDALRTHAPKLTATQVLILLFGLTGLAMVYFLQLSPENIQFDSQWKHLAFAEELVARGGIPRFPEGYTFPARPHFSSLLYAWAFMLPLSTLFDRIELAFHIELALFAWTTVVGITAVVRAIVPTADLRLIWAARFLFPGVLLYDSCLGGGADHIGAHFGPPLFLLTLRAYRQLEPRYCFLLSLMMSAAVMVKYTVAMMMVPGAVLIISIRAAMMVVGRLRGKPWKARALYLSMPLMVVTCLATTTPHWLKNYIWYGNPFYPTMGRVFDSNPWHEDASYMYEYGYVQYQFWRPERDLDGVIQTVKALATFSLDPNDYGSFHGEMPVFGALFTLLLVCLPFLRRTRRLWGLVVWIHLGLFAWYWVHHQDRYLQALAPWMAASVAAIIILVWRLRSKLLKGALVALIGFQVVWGSDVYFTRSNPRDASRPGRVVELLGRGLWTDYGNRLRTQGVYPTISKALPANSVVLLHENHPHLGLARATVSDWATWQFGIDYGSMRSPREVYDTFHGMGVTHLYWIEHESRSWDSLAADIMFFDFAYRHTLKHRRFGRHVVSEMPPTPPAKTFDDSVAFWGCGRDTYANGLYRVQDLQVPTFGPRSTEYPSPIEAAEDDDMILSLLNRVEFVVLDPDCKRLPSRQKGHFDLAARRRRVNHLQNRQFEIWMRR